MAWFRNHYRCSHCQKTWTDEWSATCDDDCPHCGARHISPDRSDDLTEIIEESDDGRFVLRRSPASAGHRPDYAEIGRFATREAAEAATMAGRPKVPITPFGRGHLRPATPRQAVALDVALARLKDARDQLKAADCPATLRKIPRRPEERRRSQAAHGPASR
jgi:DNA-directed RNA polymerase subunit RPC12/RpoP